MTPKGADLEATDLIEVSTIESGSYVTRSITGQELIDAIPLPPTGLTVGTTPIASGTVGRVLFQGTGNVLQQSSSLFWDSTNNRLGIGTSTPSVDVDIVKTIDSTFEGLNVRNLSTGTNATTVIRVKDNAGNICEFGLGGTNHTSLPNIGYFYTNKQILAFYANASERMRLSPNGNVLINTTTDAGFRLDVNGTARVQGNTTIVGTSLSSFSVSNGATAMIQTASSGIGSSDFRLRLFNNGNTQTLDLYGSGDYDHQSRHAFRTNGTERMRIFSTGNVLINTTTDAGFRLDVNGTARFVAPNTYAITYDTNGNFNAAGAYSNFSLTNAAGSLRAKLNNDGPNGTLTLYQNATGYIFLNGAQSGNNSYIATALSIGNQSAANASSILELTSTTKGFLPPRMTTTQRNAIASPAAGLVVYDNTDNKHYGYNGTTWNAFY
jgi:hypothetical protein